MNDKIKRLIDFTDKANSTRTVDLPMVLFGSEDSMFLNAMEKRAEKCGFEVERHTEEDMMGLKSKDFHGRYCVCDNETFNKALLPAGVKDLDIIGGNVPAVTNAVRVAYEYVVREPRNAKVAVIGRGYAGRYLFNGLIDQCNSIVYLHSGTSDMYGELTGRDVVIICAPRIDCSIPYSVNTVIDISGAAKGCHARNYIGMPEIGSLTTSTLVSRFAYSGGSHRGR